MENPEFFQESRFSAASFLKPPARQSAVRPARQAGSGCAAQPRKEVHNKMQPTLGAELPAQGYVPAA